MERRPPSLAKRAKNFGKALVKHTADLARRVDIEEYQYRISMCNKCELRVKNVCTHEDCGCYLEEKAWWNSENCPINEW